MEEPSTLTPATINASSELDVVRKANEATNLQAIEQCIRRDLEMTRKLTDAHCFMAISIGLNLNAAKHLIRHGLFSDWAKRCFSKELSPRTMQTYMKLSKVFIGKAKELALPKPRETGMWLMQQSRNSGELANAVHTFVGERSIAELYEDYGIKAKKDKGGWHPNNYLLKVYLQEEGHEHLADIPIEDWSEEDLAAYQAWEAAEIAANEGVLNIEAAISVWTNLANKIKTQMTRKSYAYLTTAAREDLITQLESILVELKA